MFDRWFIWKPGEYELQVHVHTDAVRSSMLKTYRFTLFESDAAELSGATDGFKRGDGVFWNSNDYSGVIVQIVEA